MKKLQSSFEYKTKDGKKLLLRWVKPEDKERIADGIKMMSDKSLYLRFFMPIKQLSDTQLNYFANVDQVNHIAWGILDETCPNIPGLGIARFVRDETQTHIAEAAVAVPDKYQGSGLGMLLLAVLHHSARVNNITVLRANILGENQELLTTLKRLGGIITRGQDNVSQVDLPVYPSLKDIPSEFLNKKYLKLLRELDSLMFT